MQVTIDALTGLPEVSPGDDLAGLIRRAASSQGHAIDGGVIVVVAQKVVSKAEGAIIDLRTVEPSGLATEWARQFGQDARLIEVILRQSRRIVKMDRGVLIAETQHGFVAANAGVDRSNVPGEDCVTVLPADPDESAERIRAALGAGVVIISDTFGRPWREGLVDVAIGVAGLEALEDYRGALDRTGRRLHGTIMAVGDQLAAAAGLVMRKAAGVPAALIRGFSWKPAKGSAKPLIRPPHTDLFR